MDVLIKKTIMKKILIITLAFGIAILSACHKDKLATVSNNVTGPTLKAPSADTTIVVTPADSANVIKITWSKADFGVQGVNTYFIQVDSAGSNFKKFFTLATVNSTTSYSLSLGSLNSQLLGNLSLAANAATSVELRVGVALFGKDTTYSKTVKIALTTYKILLNPATKLWLPGSYEGYSPATAPYIYEQSPGLYEGYTTFSASGNFKFTSAPDYNHINYGDGGGGTLTTDGNAGGIVYNSAGVYLLDANTTALTYSASLITSMGIIGPATPQGWNASTDMTYLGNYKWTITLALIGSQPLKFRANEAWDINYGPLNSNDLVGTLQFNNPGSITIPNSANYTVTIDMSQTTMNGYTYSIVQN
jgi:hypothetical protein